jgi:hypothetical protein
MLGLDSKDESKNSFHPILFNLTNILNSIDSKNEMFTAFKVKFKLHDHEFTDVIGDSVFSILYKAQKARNIFAIKRIPFSLLNNEKDSTQLQREIDSMIFLLLKNWFI